MAEYPSLSDVIEAVERLNVQKGSDRARAREKLMDRLNSLRSSLPGLDVQRSRSLARLLERSVILDITGTADIGRPVLFGLLTMVKAEVLGSDADAPITRIEVIDEAHELMGGQTDKRTADLKEGKPSSLLRNLRKTGTCGAVITHLPADLAQGARSNLGSVLVLRQGNRNCIRDAAGMLTLEAWLEDEVGRLPNHHAIARFSRHGEPVYLVMKDARGLLPGGSPPPSREQARARSKAVLEAIPFVKRGGPAQPPGVEGFPHAGDGMGGPGAGGRAGPVAARDQASSAAGKVVAARPFSSAVAAPQSPEGGLHPREKAVFARISERPYELIEDRMDALSLDREVEGDARQKLEACGLIALAGRVGAKNRVFELTARGRELAQAWRLPIARQEKGSVPHEAIVQYTQRSLGRMSPAFRFQRTGVSPTTGGVQPDLLLHLPGGGRIPIQACCRNQPAYEAAVLLRLHALALLGPGDADRVDFVLAVAVNKRHREAVERALERENGGKAPGRVVLLDFDTVVDPQFDWASVLEMPL